MAVFHLLLIFCFTQHLYDLRASAFNRLRGRFREAEAQLAAKEEELCRAQGTSCTSPVGTRQRTHWV